ncbi:hypothetical protein CONLIGDRAFT_633819 [Coniochaeta ligniaria NRRL 30616]|uniref:Uncharacterized protein n=1 Tax=Coniochaeta ligniaria NRRL 30616 TaxID=1408157 RepID=A0A1J7IJ09_9PEZI|nr:hypothetical protein CONLIGDRAFT_633819 [Coniochaeta ligniaria NRRL 30616]
MGFNVGSPTFLALLSTGEATDPSILFWDRLKPWKCWLWKVSVADLSRAAYRTALQTLKRPGVDNVKEHNIEMEAGKWEGDKTSPSIRGGPNFGIVHVPLKPLPELLSNVRIFGAG